MQGSTFTSRVYALAAHIPAGKVATYGQLAGLAGNPKAARAVGSAMRSNPNRAMVPCHRVVASNGEVAGYAFGKGSATKKSLLSKEGVCFTGERVDLTRSLWNASV